MRTSAFYLMMMVILACLTVWLPAQEQPNMVITGPAKVPITTEDVASEPQWHQGIVQWFDNQNGYGFLLTEQNQSVFIHFSNILTNNPKQAKILVSGQMVLYRYTLMAEQPPQLIILLQ